MVIFKCQRCGACCRASHIAVLAHEKLILTKIAKKFDIQVDFSYDYTIYDRYSNQKIVLTYYITLKNGVCPFLKGNTCLIHDIYKPLICRSFPYVPKKVEYLYNADLRVIKHRSTYAISTACTFIRKFKSEIERYIETEDDIKAFLPDEYLAAVKMEVLRTKYLSALSYLWRLNYINLDFSYKGYSQVVDAYTFIRRYLPYFVIDYRTY